MFTPHLPAGYHIARLSKIIDDREKVINYLKDNGIQKPKAKNENGFKARLLCEKWWRRTLDRAQERFDESKLIEAGRVAKHKEKYSSNLTVYRVGKKAIKAAEYMQNQSMVSDVGDVVDMSTIVQSSIANPANRRAELMIRMAGFEAYASEHGYVGEFYTITCPSKYHRYSGAELNYKYQQELSPRAAQNYLVGQWAKIRAAYGRLGIKPFGFRVAEPHGDGCPHWHMLLFCRAEHRDELRKIIKKYALELDGHEPGADKHRFKFVQIDPQKGSATGYVAKYISKNLGFCVDDTNESQSYGQRVKAWSTCFGIRQFQQVGGAGVTVWRQLRKLHEAIDDELLESARQAADESRWADYLEIMGGVECKRKDLKIGLVKKELIDKKTGQLRQNQYFEFITLIFGVASIAAQAITRTKNWLMASTRNAEQRRTRILDGTAGAVCFSPWSPVNNCTLVV